MLVKFSNHIPHLVVGTLLLPDRESAKIHSNQANPIIRGPNQSLTSPTGMHNSLPLLNPNYSIGNVHPSGCLQPSQSRRCPDMGFALGCESRIPSSGIQDCRNQTGVNPMTTRVLLLTETPQDVWAALNLNTSKRYLAENVGTSRRILYGEYMTSPDTATVGAHVLFAGEAVLMERSASEPIYAWSGDAITRLVVSDAIE